VKGPKVAAFFDFDRTVIDTDGGVLFGHELIRIAKHRLHERGRGTLGWFGRLAAYYGRWAWWILLSAIVRPLYAVRLIKRSTLVNLAYTTLKGWRGDELRTLASDFVDQVLVHRMYPEAYNRMKWHKEQGHVVVIATTNMKVLVDHFRRHAPIDDVLGVELLEKNGVTTGKVNGPRYGVEKAAAIRAWAHANRISLPRSYAYTDHYSDHYILPLVGHPHVVNPHRRLRRLAPRHRWPILTFPPPPPRAQAPLS
jgi:HAD superfamily hydrolase (TIGR01490 family)